VVIVSRGSSADAEPPDIERLITVEPLTDGERPNDIQFFGVPTFILLSGLAVLASIALFQVIRTW